MATVSLESFPALRTAVFFALGILVRQSTGASVESILLSSFLFVVFLTVASFIPTLARIRPFLRSFLPAFLCLVLGGLGTAVYSRTADLPRDISRDKPALLAGLVIEQPRKAGDRLRFVVEGFSLMVDSNSFPFPSRILVTMKPPAGSNFPEYGATIAVTGNVYRPRSARNPGEFDQRRYYLANGIQWIFSVRSPNGLTVVQRGGGWWFMRDVVLPVRGYFLQEIDRAIGGQEGEYLKGVLLGERGGLLPEIRSAFTAAGVAHILAVSGGNIAVVVSFVFFVAELIRLPRRLRPIAGCIGIVFYMLLVGYQPPVVRATVMATVMLFGTLLEQRPNPVNSIGVSALVILVIDPRQLFDVGFQLSFLAVLSIIILYPILDSWLVRFVPGQEAASRTLLWLLRVCAVSFVAGVGTLPLTACYFGQVSVIGVLTNIAVIPASGLSLLLGFLALPVAVLSPWIADTFHLLNQWVLWLTLELTVRAGDLSFASMETMRFEPIDALPFYAILLLLFWSDRPLIRKRMLILLLITLNLWIFWPGDPALAVSKRLRISFIDVGQGDAALVEFPDGGTILVDAGPATDAFDSGLRTVIPFLIRRGIAQIDLLIATHPHNDHIGGIPAVLKELDVRRVVDCGREAESSVFRAYQFFIRDELCNWSTAEMGKTVDVFPGARLYLLAPEHGAATDNLNNSSVVFKLVYGSASILFMGDAETESEGRLSARYGDFLKASLLKVGHHGSSTSSTDSFRALANPEVAVISVGTPNRYRHPSPDILARYKEEQTTVLRTDEEGAIVFETDGTMLERILWNDGEDL